MKFNINKTMLVLFTILVFSLSTVNAINISITQGTTYTNKEQHVFKLEAEYTGTYDCILNVNNNTIANYTGINKPEWDFYVYDLQQGHNTLNFTCTDLTDTQTVTINTIKVNAEDTMMNWLGFILAIISPLTFKYFNVIQRYFQPYNEPIVYFTVSLLSVIIIALTNNMFNAFYIEAVFNMALILHIGNLFLGFYEFVLQVVSYINVPNRRKLR